MSNEISDFGFVRNHESLTDEQKRHFFETAAYWELRIEDAERALNYARHQRRLALLALGMVEDEAQ